MACLISQEYYQGFSFLSLLFGKQGLLVISYHEQYIVGLVLKCLHIMWFMLIIIYKMFFFLEKRIQLFFFFVFCHRKFPTYLDIKCINHIKLFLYCEYQYVTSWCTNIISQIILFLVNGKTNYVSVSNLLADFFIFLKNTYTFTYIDYYSFFFENYYLQIYLSK